MRDIGGNPETICKQNIAMEYLNLVLELYVSGSNPIAALNLAAAAEEMLGKIADIKSGKSALKSLQDRIRVWFQIKGENTPSNQTINKDILRVKNGIKHIGGASDLCIELDIQYELKETIRRAIQNYNLIGDIPTSQQLLDYYRHERHNK